MTGVQTCAFRSVIGHYNGAFYAHMHVNAADRIDSVAQSAY